MKNKLEYKSTLFSWNLILLCLLGLISSCSIISKEKEIWLNPQLETGLKEYWSSRHFTDLPLILSLDSYEGKNRIAISSTSIYEDKEIIGLFNLDSIPVFIAVSSEDGFKFDSDLLELVFNNLDSTKLKESQVKFISINQEHLYDGFDPKYFLYYVENQKLKRIK